MFRVAAALRRAVEHQKGDGLEEHCYGLQVDERFV